MIFDVKDVKSWANIRELKVGDKGYFFNSISSFRDLNIDSVQCGKIRYMDENWGRCFKSDVDSFNSYYFFLPLDAVKADEPNEKKYRPLKKIKDFYDCGVIKGKDDRLIDSVLTLRDKKNYNLTRDMKVIDVEYDFDTVIRINRCSPAYYFSYFDIYINDEWVPFGVEVEEDE